MFTVCVVCGVWVGGDYTSLQHSGNIPPPQKKTKKNPNDHNNL